MTEERRKRLAILLGHVVDVSEDEDDTITLTFDDGREVFIADAGYDGIGRPVLVYRVTEQ